MSRLLSQRQPYLITNTTFDDNNISLNKVWRIQWCSWDHSYTQVVARVDTFIVMNSLAFMAVCDVSEVIQKFPKSKE